MLPFKGSTCSKSFTDCGFSFTTAADTAWDYNFNLGFFFPTFTQT